MQILFYTVCPKVRNLMPTIPLDQGYNNSTVTDYLYGDPVVTNGNFDYAAYGSANRISKYYYNLLTNMRGSGVVDPRMSKIVPASMANVQLEWFNGKVSIIYMESFNRR